MCFYISLSDPRWLAKSWFSVGFFKKIINTLDSCLFIAGIALEMVPIDSPQFLDELRKKTFRNFLIFSGKFFISKKIKIGFSKFHFWKSLSALQVTRRFGDFWIFSKRSTTNCGVYHLWNFLKTLPTDSPKSLDELQKNPIEICWFFWSKM